MTDAADPRLSRLLGGEILASLRKRLRRPFERAAAADGPARIRVAGLTAEEHAALALLTGRPQRASASLEFDVAEVDDTLRRAGVAASLRDALERLDGPILHFPTLSNHRARLWSEVVAGCDHPGLLSLLETPAGGGLLKRLARQDAGMAAQWLQRAEAVLRRLPAQGTPRSRLAAEALGDAHALDDGQPTATLVLAVLRRAPAPGTDDDEEAPPERARETWAAAGVLVNELARPALFLNLPHRGERVPGAAPGEPAYASLRALVRSPPAWDVTGLEVRVCENPNLLAIAADHWGARCAPMVCTEGMPAAAQRRLLNQLAQAGASLLYHGDFDWPGLRIGNHVMREHGAKPWRFGAADYQEAARAASETVHPLRGPEAVAPWDEALAPAMREAGLAIAEESVAESLMEDLGRG